MELHYGNLIEQAKVGKFDVIVQGCNCFHTMGAGIAKHIKNEFPSAYEADKTTKYGDKNKLGTFSETTIDINGHKLTIINAYTQFRYGTDKDHFEYDVFPQLLQSIKSKYGDKRIGLPLIGCGLAGGNEPRILKMIRDNLDGVDYKLVEIDTNRKLKLEDEENLSFQNTSNQNEEAIAFTKVSLPYGWLGNMAPYPVTHNGVEYKTTEALFQALRFEKYPEVQKAIIEQKSPMAAKMVAKSHRQLLLDDGYEFLGQKDIDYMKLCIELKLEQHPELTKQLLETGNKPIIEDCSSRPNGSGVFWGSAYQNNKWVGENILGNIWMQYRNTLRNNNTMNNNIENTPKEYTFFFNLTSPFSNFHPAKFEYKGYTFISNEQFMMFSKAKNFNDEVSAQKIIDINNEPLAKDFIEGRITREDILKEKELSSQWQNLMMKAKKLGRGVQNYDEAFWESRRYKIVLFGAREKFKQNSDLKEILMATGDSKMIESNPYDKIWGIGLSANDAKKIDPSKWPGQNLLGKVLDTLKYEFQNELVKRPKP